MRTEPSHHACEVKGASKLQSFNYWTPTVPFDLTLTHKTPVVRAREAGGLSKGQHLPKPDTTLFLTRGIKPIFRFIQIDSTSMVKNSIRFCIGNHIENSFPNENNYFLWCHSEKYQQKYQQKEMCLAI